MTTSVDEDPAVAARVFIVTKLTIDDIERRDLVIPLVDDRQKHEVELRSYVAQS